MDGSFQAVYLRGCVWGQTDHNVEKKDPKQNRSTRCRAVFGWGGMMRGRKKKADKEEAVNQTTNRAWASQEIKVLLFQV